MQRLLATFAHAADGEFFLRRETPHCWPHCLRALVCRLVTPLQPLLVLCVLCIALEIPDVDKMKLPAP